MKLNSIWILVAAALSLTACGAASPCDRPSPCANDVMATAAQRTDCRNTLSANMNSACYSETLSVLSCILDSTVCDSGGRTDPTLSSTKATNNCQTQNNARITCCQKSPTATACQ